MPAAKGKIYGPMGRASTALERLNNIYFICFSSIAVPHSQPNPIDASPGPQSPSGSVARSPRGASARVRWAALAFAAILGCGLAIASHLQPDSRGLGTHQQLGLPPCSMRMLFGIRCPGCGMTTSWAYFARGQWHQSFATNPGGFLLACLSALALMPAMVAFWTAQSPSARTQRIAAAACVVAVSVTMLDWLLRLTIG